MNTPLRALAALALAAAFPAAALAQGGKIDDVDRSARSGGARPSDSHDGGGGGCNILCGLVHSLIHHDHDTTATVTHPDSVELPTQTYGRYPWGGPRPDQVFVTRGPYYRTKFGVGNLTYFKDAASTLDGISLGIEGAFQEAYASFNFTLYEESTAVSQRSMTSMRLGIGGLGRLGRGFFTAGLDGRMVCLDDDLCAGGFDVAVGARVLPLRPFVLSGDARLGPMKWHDGDWFLATEYNASAGIQLGRFELGAGWHWLKLGSANAFGGPMLIGRVWF